MKPRWTPTHCITFTPVIGAPQTWMVMLMAAAPDAAGDMWAMTHGEWLSRTEPAWKVNTNGRWQWRGCETPKGSIGTVEVDMLSGAHAIIPERLVERARCVDPSSVSARTATTLG
jgi:hypothetical protein